MIVLIRRVSIPEFRKHLLRYCLTLLGVLLGVAIFFGVRTANSSLKTALRETIDRIAGKAALQVTAGEAGIAESAVDELLSVPGVEAAVPIIEAVVRSTDPQQGNILILGVDTASDRSIRDYALDGEEEIADPLVFLAQPDSLIISQEFAARNHLREGDQLALVTALGKRTFTIRGIMAPRGLAKAFGGNIGVMDIYAAQFVFSRGRFFDRIDISLQEGAKIDEVQQRIQARIGPGFKVEPPLRRGRQTEGLMEAFALALFFSSLVALLVGVFLIFNVFSVSLTQRRSQIGILRALGVSRRRIQRLFLAEGLLLGLVGSLTGIGVGIFLGRTMMLFMASLVDQLYGIKVSVEQVHLDIYQVALAIALGVGASAGGAYLPARAAGRVEPALALQRGKFQIMYLGENWRRRWVGGLLILISLGLGYTEWGKGLKGQLLLLASLFLGLTLLVPTFSHFLAGLLRRPMEWLFGMEGRLASDSLVQAPRRTSATVSALMFSLAFVISSASLSSGVKTSMMRWVDSTVNPDLLVSASDSLTRSFQFPGEMASELKKIAGVKQVDSLRMRVLEYEGNTPLLLSIEMDQYLRRATPIMEEGRVAEVLPRMLGRKGVLISNNLARLHNLGKGDRVFLDTPSGRQEFEVAGVYVDYTWDKGTFLLDRQVYTKLWKDDRVDTFDLMLEEGYDPAKVQQEIQRRFADERNVFVLTNQEFRLEVLRLANQFWTLTYVQLMVAVLVGVLGILNSLTVSITERRREIAVLRALGGARRRVRKAICLEAVCVGLVALVLGTVVGATLGHYVIGTVGVSVTGWIFPYEFPLPVVLGLIPGIVLVSAGAAWYPSSLALKTALVEGLAYE